MSQIASGYGLSSSLMNQLLPLAEDRNYKAFWSLLFDQATETTPNYSFSGSVVAIATVYLEGKGVRLPVNDAHPTVRAMLSAELSLEMCCEAEQAVAVLAAMQQLEIDDSELGSYYVEFTGEEWDQAIDALREGLDYIKRTLLLAQSGYDWIMLFIG
jgi:hypothetical protein